MLRFTFFWVLFVISDQLYRLLHCHSYISSFSPPFESAWAYCSARSDHLSPFSLIGLLLPFPSPSFFDSPFPFPSLYFPSFESAWTYCSARSWEFFFYLLFTSPLSSAASSFLPPPSSPSFPSLSLPSFPLLSCVPAESSLWHIAQLAPFSASFSLFSSLWIRLGILSGSFLGSPPLPSLLLSYLCFFLRSLPPPLLAVSLGIFSGSLLLSSLAFVSLPYHPRSSLTLPFLSRLNDVLPY